MANKNGEKRMRSVDIVAITILFLLTQMLVCVCSSSTEKKLERNFIRLQQLEELILEKHE